MWRVKQIPICRIEIRAHFYTPFGAVRRVRFCTAPKPPLCKGRWHGVSRDGGIVRQDFATIERLRRNRIAATIPQSASLTAPFAQGSLGRCRASAKRILPVRFLKGRIFLQWRGSAQSSLVQRELSAKLTEGLLPQYEFAEAFL